MDNHPFILHAYLRHTNMKAEMIDLPRLVESIKTGQGEVLAYIDARDETATSEMLVDQLGFDRLAVEDALSPNERPAMYEYKKHLFMVIPSIAHHDGDETYVEIAAFLGANFLVIVTYEKAPAVDKWLKRWEKIESRDSLPFAFDLHSLIDAIVDGYFPVCDDIEEAVDLLEDLVFQKNSDIVEDALKLKRRLLFLRQRITPVRDVVNGLLRRDVKFIPKEVQPFLQDVYDHALRVTEMVDINRDIIAGVLDAHLAQVSNNLNVSMRILTVMATFLMTGSLIAGIYGMNFKYMPELQQAWGYPFSLVLMGVLGYFEYQYFKRKGWF